MLIIVFVLLIFYDSPCHDGNFMKIDLQHKTVSNFNLIILFIEISKKSKQTFDIFHSKIFGQLISSIWKSL